MTHVATWMYIYIHVHTYANTSLFGTRRVKAINDDATITEDEDKNEGRDEDEPRYHERDDIIHDRVKRVKELRQRFERRSVGVVVGQPVVRRTNQQHRRVEVVQWEPAGRAVAQAVLRRAVRPREPADPDLAASLASEMRTQGRALGRTQPPSAGLAAWPSLVLQLLEFKTSNCKT